MKQETPIRLLPKTLAARYCGVPVSRFANVCPARPIRLAEAERPKYDIKDLDAWIEAVKQNNNDEYLDRL